MAVLVPEKSEWEKLKDELKLYETRCNSIKSRIATVKDSQERDSKILKWISPHDIHKSYKSVQERTKMDKQYRNRCRWLIETSEFELWYSLQTTTVLWLNGTIGTGKTTLMVRAIREIERSSMVEIEAKPFAKFFFEKARSSSDSLLSIETCLRSLVRQLSWNHATSNIEPVSERKYNEFQDDHADDSSLTTGECLHLLIDLISEKDVYIMIDAIDECNDAEGLLETLKELMILLNERKKRRGYLHLMLCGRSYLPVSDYFEKCFTILATSADSLKDQYFFIDREIDRTKKIKSGSLFVTSGKNFPERLGRILKKKGKGIFRWIEIKIEYFRKHHFRDTREIEEQLDQLETSTKEPELYDEYKRLLNLLSARQRACATTMLKFVASSFWPLSAVSVAQAITAQGFGTSNSDITAEDVRRLLVGFISEVPAQPQLPFSIINWFYENERLLPRFEIPRYTDDGDNFVLELGHASVLEYLVESMDKRTTADDFSTSAQHAEAALLCFASISNWHRLESTSNFPSILLSDGISIEGYRKGLSDLFYYSCKTWPQHCKRAFPGDNSTHVIEKTRDFILSDSYLTWNSAIRGIQRRKWGSSQIANEQNSVWHDPKLRMPGFVIIINGLTELFKFLEIHDIVSLSDNNGIGQDLFTVAVQFSKPGVMGHILQLFPGPVRWNGEWRPLYLAATKLHIEAVRALLDSRQDSALDTKSITKALQEAILEMSIYLDEDEVGILLWPIINLLASKGDTSKLPYWQRREIERRVC
jgi:hypothetical protein